MSQGSWLETGAEAESIYEEEGGFCLCTKKRDSLSFGRCSNRGERKACLCGWFSVWNIYGHTCIMEYCHEANAGILMPPSSSAGGLEMFPWREKQGQSVLSPSHWEGSLCIYHSYFINIEFHACIFKSTLCYYHSTHFFLLFVFYSSWKYIFAK